jgi:GNAT superfamily N-acetyltransferase
VAIACYKGGSILIIREAGIDDYKDICLLNRDGLGYEYPLEKTKERLAAIISATTDAIFVAENDGKIVGYIHLEAYECTYSDSVKNVLALAVDENYRRMGIGRQLIQMAEEWAKSCGAVGIRLVSGYNREIAHKFYQSCGFTLRKEQKNFIKLF